MSLLLLNQHLIDNQSMASDITSEVIDLSSVSGFAVHSIWTGVPVGNIIIQGSNNSENFVDLATVAAGGAAGQNMFNYEHVHFRYIRVFYDSTSGTGNLDVYVSAKSF